MNTELSEKKKSELSTNEKTKALLLLTTGCNRSKIAELFNVPIYIINNLK